MGWPATDLRVLSLGCTTEAFNTGHAPPDALRLGRWALKIVDLFMTAQSSASMGTAAVLIGHDAIHRISPHVANGRFSVDGVREIGALKGLGDSEARKALPAVRPVFFGQRAEPFVPFRAIS